MRSRTFVVVAALALSAHSLPAIASANEYYVGKTAAGEHAGVIVKGREVIEMFVSYRSRCSIGGKPEQGHHTGSSQIKHDLPLNENGRFRYRYAHDWGHAAIRYHVAGEIADGRASGAYVDKFRDRTKGEIEKCTGKARFDLGRGTRREYERAFEHRI